IAPPQTSSTSPRCFAYQAASSLWSPLDLMNTPPMPVTFAMPPSLERPRIASLADLRQLFGHRSGDGRPRIGRDGHGAAPLHEALCAREEERNLRGQLVHLARVIVDPNAHRLAHLFGEPLRHGVDAVLEPFEIRGDGQDA